jgi:hypothetical protein
MSDVDAALRRLVVSRSQSCCEYCRVPTAFDESPACVDHIIARKHRGQTSAENLALTCYHDNSFKGDNIAGLDPDSNQLTRLFNPRTDQWAEHSEWNAAELIGLTAIGRTTLYVLNMNDPVRVLLRRLLVAAGDMRFV